MNYDKFLTIFGLTIPKDLSMFWLLVANLKKVELISLNIGIDFKKLDIKKVDLKTIYIWLIIFY
jgi:hypothetical protein